MPINGLSMPASGPGPTANPEDHFVLANRRAAAGDWDRAAADYRCALERNPDHPEAWNNLGLALKHLARGDEALAALCRAVALKPDFSEAYNNLGNLFRDQGRLDEADRAYRRALALDPRNAGVLYNLGGVHLVAGRLDEARRAYEEAIALRPAFAMAANNLAVALNRLDQAETALAVLEKALALEPENAEIHNNLGIVLERLDRLDDALRHCRRAVALRPDSAEGYNTLGVALNATGRWAEARSAFTRAVRLKPDFSEARFNHGVACLLAGDFQPGWRDYESRFERPDWTHIHPHRYRLPRWRGEALTGRRIYIHDEQGFGDTIQFVRYLPRLKALGAFVVLETRKPLMPLLKDMAGVDRVVERPASAEPAASCDLFAPLMSLAGIFGTDDRHIPAPIPYLKADSQRSQNFRRIAGEAGLRAGLVWSGSANHQQDRRRSLPLTAFACLAKIPAVRLFGLQKGKGAEEVEAAGFLETNLGDRFEDFADTAAAMEALDLVIGVDTAAVHLAGALGKEVWTLLPFAPDWRWGLSGTATAWYPGMTLFRQSKPSDWAGVMEQVAAELKRRAAVSISESRVRGLSPHATGTKRNDSSKGGSPPEAMSACPIFSDPDDPPDLDAPALRRCFEQATGLLAKGRSAEAEALCRRILARTPDHPATLNLAAVLARRRGAEDEAAALMERAVAAAPEKVSLQSNLGRILLRLGRSGAAVQAFERALALTPDDGGAILDLARALDADARPQEAEAVLRHIPPSNPARVAALNLLGTLLGRGGRADEAMAAFDEALARDPASADAWTNKGALLYAGGRFKEATEAFDRALNLAPDHVDARFNRAQARLLAADFSGGWADYEARLQKPAWRRLHPGLDPARRWRGQPPGRGRLWVCDEQGLGDTLQFVRYLPLLADRGHRVALYTAPSLVSLFKTMEGVEAVVARQEAGPAMDPSDRFVPLLSLPEVFGTTLATVPAPVPYLRADARLAAEWRSRMPGPGLRVGLVWSGNPAHANDRRRSCPLERLRPMLEVSGVTWFGLQKGDGARQMAHLPDRLRFTNLGNDFADFADTAAAMNCLDLVVTVDTAVAHLAGAMGKQTWVLLPFVPDWRWLTGRSDSPWYPTLTLFRQLTIGDWDQAAARVARALRVSVAAAKERT